MNEEVRSGVGILKGVPQFARSTTKAKFKLVVESPYGVSRVYFDDEEDMALFEVNSRELWGSKFDVLHRYEKHGDRWIRIGGSVDASMDGKVVSFGLVRK